MLDAEVEAINAEASVLMKRGIAFLEEPRREAHIDALQCFDEALALRRQVPAGHSSTQGYLLAACLLNRADALVRFNDAGPLAAALTSFDEAIEVLQALPLAEDPRYARRLALAHQNRGLALQIRSRPDDVTEAADSFAAALAVLDDDLSAAIDDRDQLRATVWLNLANLHVRESAIEALGETRDAATRSLNYVRGMENDDAQAAVIGLHARHVICRACAVSLTETSKGGGMPEEVHEATDTADDGLGLVHRWEQRGIDAFRMLAVDFFRFGARVYALYMPQFLEEFIAENMDPARSSPGYVNDPHIVAAANEARSLVPQ